jgi:hypothetical protein
VTLADVKQVSLFGDKAHYMLTMKHIPVLFDLFTRSISNV